jgi:hypothetical protein
LWFKGLATYATICKCAPLYFDYLNSYAVELAEAGRLNEALEVIKTVVSSPYVSHFSNWVETEKEIRQKVYRSSVIRVPLLLNEENEIEVEDNVIKFPHSVDMEKIEQESLEDFKEEMRKSLELSDNCTLHEFIEDIFMGGMKPDRFGRFLMKMNEFKNIKMLQDVIESMLHQTFLNTEEFKEGEAEWRERLLQESVDS